MLKDLRSLYSNYPRQFAKPERYQCSSFGELVRDINLYITCARCYCSVYDYTPSHTRVTLDRIVFDFDGEDAIDELRKFVEKFGEYKHTAVFSGGGFHVYVKCCNYEKLKNPKQALMNAHNWFETQGIKNDKSIKGDIARILAVPGTFNFRRGRYVVFIDSAESHNNLTYFQKKAERQQSKMVIHGEKLFDMSIFDNEPERPKMQNLPDNFSTKIPEGDALLKSLPPCVASMLAEKGDWKARWYATLWLKEAGFPKEMVNQIAAKYFSKFPRKDKFGDNYRQYVAVKTLDYAYDREDFFPSCEILNSEGYCIGKCKHYNSMYKE